MLCGFSVSCLDRFEDLLGHPLASGERIAEDATLLAVGVLERQPHISDEDLLDVLSSNLCRCTGYQNIVKAVRAAAEEMRKR